jgi:hypothetical protein
LGRRKIEVRICSSPKRDITKAENDSEAKQDQKTSEGKVAIPHPDQQNQRGKKRKYDEFFQQAFLGQEEFLNATLYAQARLKRVLKVEKWQPTEKEAALLQKYIRKLNPECGSTTVPPRYWKTPYYIARHHIFCTVLFMSL